MGQAVDEIKVDGGEAQFAHPPQHLLGHLLRLNPVHGFLDFRIEILDAERSAVETHFAQRRDMVAGQTARIDFHARFDVDRKM